MPRIPMPRPIPVFQANRITLRPPNPEEDARDYFTLNLDPDMPNSDFSLASVEEAREELKRILALPLISTWMVVENSSNRVVGRFFLCLEDRGGALVAGEGNRFARPYWRKGYSLDARNLLVPYVFGELAADWIETAVWEDNETTIEAIKASGFELHHDEIEWNERQASEMTMRHYVLTREQWQAKQQNPKRAYAH